MGVCENSFCEFVPLRFLCGFLCGKPVYLVRDPPGVPCAGFLVRRSSFEVPPSRGRCTLCGRGWSALCGGAAEKAWGGRFGLGDPCAGPCAALVRNTFPGSLSKLENTTLGEEGGGQTVDWNLEEILVRSPCAGSLCRRVSDDLTNILVRDILVRILRGGGARESDGTRID